MKSPVYIAPVVLAISITSVTYAEEGSTSGWLSKADYGLMAHYEVFGVDRISPEEYNRRVNSFKVDSFVEQVKESGAGYVILTLGQNSGYYCAPNKTYDKLLGVEPGQKTATRDLLCGRASQGSGGPDRAYQQQRGWHQRISVE